MISEMEIFKKEITLYTLILEKGRFYINSVLIIIEGLPAPIRLLSKFGLRFESIVFSAKIPSIPAVLVDVVVTVVIDIICVDIVWCFSGAGITENGKDTKGEFGGTS